MPEKFKSSRPPNRDLRRPRVGSSRASRGTVLPIYVIGGFLGGGKTTLLRRLLAHELARGARPTVIMNEFAEADVDGASLRDPDHEHEHDFDMSSLLNGCVCCDLSGELTRTLKTVLRRARGAIFVETTGLADVGQVADAVTAALAGARERRRARLASVIAVVDAVRSRRRRSDEGRQSDLAAADTIVLNKVEGQRAGTVRRLEAQIRDVNPRARIFRATFADVPPAELLDTAPRPVLPPRPAGASSPLRESTKGFVSVTAQVLGRVDATMLDRLLAKHESRIVRVKGFVRTVGTRGMQELQWVPGALRIRPRSRAAGMKTHLVMVGRRMNWERFVTDLDRCVKVPGGKEVHQ